LIFFCGCNEALRIFKLTKKLFVLLKIASNIGMGENGATKLQVYIFRGGSFADDCKINEQIKALLFYFLLKYSYYI
jgi:hypothetical protein